MFKLADKVFYKGHKADGVFEYLNEVNSLLSQKCKATDYTFFLNIDNVETTLKVNLSYQLKSLMKKRKETKATKKDFTNSLYALDIVKFAQAHIRFISFKFFRLGIKNDDIKCPINLKNLQNLCILNGLC